MFVFCSLLYVLPIRSQVESYGPHLLAPISYFPGLAPVPSLEILGLGLFPFLAGEEALEVAGAFFVLWGLRPLARQLHLHRRAVVIVSEPITRSARQAPFESPCRS
jgi:hypothetical protein